MNTETLLECVLSFLDNDVDKNVNNTKISTSGCRLAFVSFQSGVACKIIAYIKKRVLRKN